MTVVGRMRLLRSLFFQTATPASCTADASPNEWNMISSIDWPYPSSSVPMRPSATFSLPVHSQRHAPRGKRGAGVGSGNGTDPTDLRLGISAEKRLLLKLIWREGSEACGLDSRGCGWNEVCRGPGRERAGAWRGEGVKAAHADAPAHRLEAEQRQ